LQKALLAVVGGTKVSCVQKRLVSGHVASREELSGQHSV
jgi:hypothetical protein